MLSILDIRPMPTLTIFILCHNRPDDTRQAIVSVLAQTDRDFDLVVSDNSSNDEVERFVKAEFPQVDYRRRLPMLPALAHFNRCMDEAGSDYFCLFHDDDLMHPDFVRKLRQVLDEHPQAVACACNARVETMGRIEPRTSFRSLGRLERIVSPRDLAQRYFARAQSGFAPFPAYVYRRSAVGELRLDPEGGKYTDVAWLLNLAKKGLILWLNEPLMTYRIHGGNDGKIDSLRDRLRLLRFIKRNVDALGRDLLADYRCSHIYKPLARDASAPPARHRLAVRFLRHYGWQRHAHPGHYRALLKRLIVKGTNQ